jgi:mycofactocin glycosyltransferase
MTAPMPAGVRIVPDADTTTFDAHSLIGGTPRRVMRLSTAGQAAWAELLRGPVRSTAAGILARRLTDGGLAHPHPGAEPGAIDVTVVIPARDRPMMLDRCLEAVGGRQRVVVVDDGSLDPDAIAGVARRHDARLIARETTGGPAVARNDGLLDIRTELVAFLDSDCIPPPGWVEQLAAHFSDPLVAAVAPRVIPASRRAHSYLATCGNLDLGDRAARVLPGGRVAYLPTAALVVRRTALAAVSRDGNAFDPALRYGEDVDLIWRLHAAGWRVRYDPSVEVRHDEPTKWRERLARRFNYGTSAASLAQRHPGALAPLVLHPWPTLAVAGLLTRRPVPAFSGLAMTALAARRALDRADISDLGARQMTTASITRTWRGIGRYATQFGAPAVVAALVVGGEARGLSRWSRRLAAASVLVGPPLSSWLEDHRSVNPLRFVAGQVADDVAYGTGVYAGCLRHRTLAPLLPVVVRSAGQRRAAG